MFASANATSNGSDAALVRMRIAMSRCANPLATRSATRVATAAASSASSAHCTISGSTPAGRCDRNHTAVPLPDEWVVAGPSPRSVPTPADPEAPAPPSPPGPIPAVATPPPIPPRPTAGVPRMTELATATISGVQR